MTIDLKLPEYAHRRFSVSGKISPAQLYRQLLYKSAVFTIGADCADAMVQQTNCQAWKYYLLFL